MAVLGRLHGCLIESILFDSQAVPSSPMVHWPPGHGGRRGKQGLVQSMSTTDRESPPGDSFSESAQLQSGVQKIDRIGMVAGLH